MQPTETAAWQCTVCGYIHHGPEPPDECPVCGVSSDEFEPHAEEVQVAPAAAPRRWRCLICDYVHEGDEPPDECPICAAGADQFEPIEEETASTLAPPATTAKIVVVGAGIAGLAAVEALRTASPEAEIALISREPELPYYRLNLTRYLAGEIGEDAFPIHPEEWYAENDIRLLRGSEVRNISPDDRTVQLDDGTQETYEKLILTAGAHPFIPPFPGAQKENVYCLRTLVDARQILEKAGPGARCVCIGGGILGLETAGALAHQGVEVSLLESHGWLLPRQLNRRAGELLERHVESLGIELLHQASTEEIAGEAGASFVTLQDGGEVPADLVVIATGVRSNSYLARQAGLTVDKGIVVDDHLYTSHPDILAAGDVAEHRGVLYGTWMAAQSQGKIAGMNAAGLDAEFAGIPRSNTLKVLGLDLFSIGRIEPEDASYDVIEREAEDTYHRFLFRDGHMVGAILLGDAAQSAQAATAIESGRDFSSLLRQHPTAPDILAALAESRA